MTSLNILLALYSLTRVSAMAQSATDEDIMPAAEIDPATNSFDLHDTPRIESVYFSSTPDVITVKLDRTIEDEAAYIRAQSITDNQAIVDTPIRQGESQLKVDLAKLPAGAVVIQLILNKNRIDNTIVVKK